MYHYEYESVEFVFGGWELGRGNVFKIDDFREIIKKRAEAGWRYVGNIPTLQRVGGQTESLDLIFEKVV